jgi:hypothetical protein
VRLTAAMLALALVLVVGLAACGSTATPAPSVSSTSEPSNGDPSSTPSATATPAPEPTSSADASASPETSPDASPGGSREPSIVPSASPAGSAGPAPSPTPIPPTATEVWVAAGDAIRNAGRVSVRVTGPSPGTLRYEPDASATVIGGSIVFVCRDSAAYDGQNGFRQVPGTWACGVAALVSGFRTTGQPLGAWSPSLPLDTNVNETVQVLPDGTWRWAYQGRNPVFGGQIRAEVIVDPATGRVTSGSRTDPTGKTTYSLDYAASFPTIVVP